MDAYYAQVEMKRHSIDASKAVAVQQWQSIIALSYAAKTRGVRRSMTVYDALDVCPELILVHVGTFEVREFTEVAKQILHDRIIDKSKQKMTAFGLKTSGEVTITSKEQVIEQHFESDLEQLSESSQEDQGGNFIPSSICKVKKLSENPSLEPYRRWWVQMRQKENQKVSLKLYRRESKRIFKILRRFSLNVEKASCDEAYIDVTSEVNMRFQLAQQSDYDALWHNSLFMGFALGEARFEPVDEEEKKLFLATEIAHQARAAIKKELGYNASAGVSLNKTVAKISCGENKPNGMTVVPRRYMKQALAGVPIKNVRWLGGKLGKQLRDEGL